jgi:rhodanese-related sulfurtransferase
MPSAKKAVNAGFLSRRWPGWENVTPGHGRNRQELSLSARLNLEPIDNARIAISTESMKMISPVELQRRLAAEPNLTLLDVRTPAEFAEVHVPQARSIPLDEINPKDLAGSGQLRKDQAVYFLCRSGQRATKAAEKFATEGFAEPIVVQGGTLAWVEANLPVTRGTTKVISLERQVRIAAGALVLTGVLLGWFVHRGFLGLSAFVATGLIFSGITDFCGMGLLLARMPWNRR